MRIFLVRHGQTDWNTKRLAQGHSEAELDETGLHQAELLAERFGAACGIRIFSSDLKRCQQTAAPTAKLLEIEPKTTELLRERTFGCLEGKHYTVVRAWLQGEMREREQTFFDVCPPEGESLQQVWDRLDGFINELYSSEQNAIVFSHGGTCSLLLCRLLELPISASISFRFENASITEIVDRGDSGRQLIRYSDTLHLDL